MTDLYATSLTGNQALVYPYRTVWIKEFILETKQLQLVRYGYQKDHQTRRQSS